MYRLVRSGLSVSIICSIRSMFSVVTPSTWVSPRSNSADPCTRGSTCASADSGRMSVSPRPSMRLPSAMIRCRTSFLVSARNAALISFSRSSNWLASLSLASALTRSVSASRSCLPTIVRARDSSSVTSAATASYTSCS